MKQTSATKTSYHIPVGPIHPALKEPVFFEFEIDGERIVDVDVKLGHVHRAVEWASRKRNPIQILYLAERICGICSYCHPAAFALAVEAAADIEVPERAEYLRVIQGELERICSHILWAGVAAHEIGFDTVLFLTWEMREKALDLTEYLTGNRVTKGIMTIGGIRRDITKDMIPRIQKDLKYFLDNFEKIRHIFLDDKTFKLRSQNTGILTKEERTLRYDKITDISAKQGIVGQIFGFGTIIPISQSGFGLGADKSFAGGGVQLGVKKTKVLGFFGGGRELQTPRSRSYYELHGVHPYKDVKKLVENMVQDSVVTPYQQEQVSFQKEQVDIQKQMRDLLKMQSESKDEPQDQERDDDS